VSGSFLLLPEPATSSRRSPCPAHLAEFLPIRVRNEGLERLKACVDALHTPPLVAVGDLPSNPPLLVSLGLRS
jgi:hypothetical protein